MIRKTIGKLWKSLPRALRTRITRLANSKFTISVAAIIVNERREALLLDHVLRPKSGWGLPGGFLDGGEAPGDAIKREVFEETGLTLEDIRLHSVNTVALHLEILFTARAVGEAEIRSREIYRLGWFSRDALPDGLTKAQRSLIQDVLDT